MSGWKLSSGELITENVDDVELWRVCNYVFMGKSQKTNTYKFSLMKSIIDTACDAELISNGMYFIDYEMLFEAFTKNYWNLVLKYGLKQMRYNKRMRHTMIETIILKDFIENEEKQYIDFDNYNESRRKKVIYKVAKECSKFVLGALYSDTEGYIYGFDKSGDGIYLSKESCEFLKQNEEDLNMINLMSWASFLDESNDDNFIKNIMSELGLKNIIDDSFTMYNDILNYEFTVSNKNNASSVKAYDLIIERFIEESDINRIDRSKVESKSKSKFNIEKQDNITKPILNLEKIAISDNEINKAREVLAINQKKLVIEEQIEESCNSVSNDIIIQDDDYSQVQKEILKCLASGNEDDLKKMIRENNINIALEIERINEISMDDMGDILVEFDGLNYYIYEDYIDYVNEM